MKEKIWLSFNDFIHNSQRIFLLALVSGIILSLLSVFFIHDMYRDVAGVYAYYAREIGMGNWAGGWVGRVPMFHILLSGILASAGFEAYTATIIVSSTFYILTLFPLRSFLERYLSPIQAAWGCLLFILAPKVIRFSTSGLLDSARYFFLIAALLFFFRLADHAKLKDGVFLGLSLAGLSVSRGEGFPVAIALLLFFPVFVLMQKKIVSRGVLRRYFSALVIALFFWLLGILPFCMVNQCYNHVFVTDLRIAEVFTGTKDSSAETRSAAQEVAGGDHSPISVPDSRNAFLKNTLDSINSTLRGAYEIYLVFAVLGMILLALRKKWNWEYSLLLGLYVLHTVIYIKISSAYRYSIYLIPLFMPFTVLGLDFCRKQLLHFCERKLTMKQARWIMAVFTLCCVVVLISQVINGMDMVIRRNDVMNRKVSAFIREYAAEHFPGQRLRLAAKGQPEIVYWSESYSVWDYKSWIVPPDPRTFRDFDLLMLDKDEVQLVSSCNDLILINSPREFPVVFYRKTVPPPK